MNNHAPYIKAKVKRFVVMDLHHFEDKSAMMETQKILTDVIQTVILKKTLCVKLNL